MARSTLGKIGTSVLPRKLYQTCCRSYDRAQSILFLLGSLGGNRQCPLCGTHLKRFRPDDGEPSELFFNEHIVGGGPIEDAVCPRCGSFERERQVFLYLRDEAGVFAQDCAVMHVAPERRIQRLFREREKGSYVSVDLQSPHADVHADLCSLPFPDKSFDIVICNHVLEHVPDDRRAMREILRVLKENGWAMLQVPIAAKREETEEDLAIGPDERLRRFGQRDHVRLYGQDYPKRLENEGFRVMSYRPLDQHGPEYMHRYGLIEDEIIFVASKE